MKKFSAIAIVVTAILAGSVLLYTASNGTDAGYETLSAAERQDLEAKFKRFNVILVGQLSQQTGSRSHWTFHVEEIFKNLHQHTIEKTIPVRGELAFSSFAHNQDPYAMTLLRELYVGKRLLLFGHIIDSDGSLRAYTGYMLANGASSNIDHTTEVERKHGLPRRKREIGFGGTKELFYLRKLAKDWEKEQPLNMKEEN